MSERKPFWSSVPGVATGVAGIVSAIVGLLGISVQLGWIGGDGDGSGNGSSVSAGPSTTFTTLRGSAPTTTLARAGEFEVEQDSVTFEPLKPREATVTVRNTGDVSLTMRPPTVSGSDAESFEADDVSCTRATLAPGRSCEIKVTFTPPQPGEYDDAVVVVSAANAPRQAEVDLNGTATLLG